MTDDMSTSRHGCNKYSDNSYHGSGALLCCLGLYRLHSLCSLWWQRLSKMAVALCLALQVTAMLGLVLAAQLAQAAPDIESWKADRGALVYLMRTDALPLVDVRMDFDAGNRRNPAQQAGLADATAMMLEKGVKAYQGLPAADEATLGNAWSDIGAQFSVSASAERFSFQLRSLSTQSLLDKAVALAAQQIAAPAWDDAIWQRERERLSATLAEENTHPSTQAQNAYMKAVYGSHPYGQVVTEHTLAAIGVTDLQTFYRRHIQPCHAKISVVGALNRQQANALVEQLLAAVAGKSAACDPLDAVPAVQPLSRASMQNIPFDAAQAYIYMGQPGYKRSDADHLALYVGNYILGSGGFTSRLMQEVREKRGLTYGVGSHFEAGLHAGAFTIGLQTRPEQAQEALQVVRGVLNDFVAQGVSAVELKAAKDNLAGSMGLRTDSNRKLLGYLSYIAWHNLPLTYLDDWQGAINAVSRQQIHKAFARVLQPDTMATVVLGAAVK